ncbi:MAG TPA: winged helix-turn-helix domain-containing protein [Gammaproteobacteria bacterium]
MEQIPDKGFQLGACYVEPAESKIISSRGPEHVEPRVLDVLLVLVGFAGQTVSREELINRVWNTSFVSDEVLSRCVSLLRKHLGDDSREPRYIETIPKKGYRLIAKVSEPVTDDIEREAPARHPAIYESIAVLPFANLSNDAEYEYFSDGMAEELLTLLAKTSELKVAARTSAFYFKDQNVDIRLIGERLGVDAVLMGSVRHTGNQIRVSTQLLDTTTGYHIWSETYDKTIADFFALQIELSGAIVNALRSAIASKDRDISSSREAAATSDFHAYQLYLQGKFHLNRRGEDPIRKSISLFQAACTRDENFARAHVAMAQAWSVLPFYSNESVRACFERANNFARRALEIDDRVSEAHTVLAYTSMHLWEWQTAQQEFQRALAGHSTDPSVHQWYAQFLSMVGDLEGSAREMLKAYDVDPVSPAVNERLAFTYLLQGKNELADELFQAATALGFERTALLDPYNLLLWRMKRLDEMASLLVSTGKQLGFDDAWANMLMKVLRNPRDSKELLLTLSGDRYRRGLPVIFAASIFAAQVDISFELANQLVEKRGLNIEAMLIPEAEAFRRDARFNALVKKVGLYDYWESTRWPEVFADKQ